MSPKSALGKTTYRLGASIFGVILVVTGIRAAMDADATPVMRIVAAGILLLVGIVCVMDAVRGRNNARSAEVVPREQRVSR
jgi:hypothetical protein